MAHFARSLSLVALLVSALGLGAGNQGLVAPIVGFQVCIGSALLGGLVSVVVGLFALVRTRGGRDPQAHTKAWVGVAVGLGLILAVLSAAQTGGDAPPINDITTDLAEPPAFAPVSVVSDYAGRDMSYPAEFVEIVRKSYPDLAPLHVESPVDATYERAIQAAESLGWTISARSDADHTFDAKDTTKLFRFVDDVAVRVRADGTGARIDVRSKSRDGRGDLGANANRIRRFLAAMK